MSIHPTDTTTRCPKCGYDSASYRYEPGYQRHHIFEATNDPCREVNEHMHRQCLQCTYEWAEGIRLPGICFEHEGMEKQPLCPSCYPGKVIVHDDGKRHWRGSPCAKCNLQEEPDATPLS